MPGRNKGFSCSGTNVMRLRCCSYTALRGMGQGQGEGGYWSETAVNPLRFHNIRKYAQTRHPYTVNQYRLATGPQPNIPPVFTAEGILRPSSPTLFRLPSALTFSTFCSASISEERTINATMKTRASNKHKYTWGRERKQHPKLYVCCYGSSSARHHHHHNHHHPQSCAFRTERTGTRFWRYFFHKLHEKLFLLQLQICIDPGFIAYRLLVKSCGTTAPGG
jgi:hypothetical protein